MSIELIRINDSPSESSRKAAFVGMLLLHVKSPKDSTSVTVRLDWGVPDCAASTLNKQQACMRESGSIATVAQLQDLFFNLASFPAHTVKRPNQSYKITLMQLVSSGFSLGTSSR